MHSLLIILILIRKFSSFYSIAFFFFCFRILYNSFFSRNRFQLQTVFTGFLGTEVEYPFQLHGLVTHRFFTTSTIPSLFYLDQDSVLCFHYLFRSLSLNLDVQILFRLLIFQLLYFIYLLIFFLFKLLISYRLFTSLFKSFPVLHHNRTKPSGIRSSIDFSYLCPKTHFAFGFASKLD